ncbi:MAG: PaaI family thioesterase [Proteobacteria bacterium]|nr:PaaI family thioesterase [Pseudomonadota bacterium]
MNISNDPDLGPQEGWTEIHLDRFMPNFNSFVSYNPEGDRLRIRYFYRDSDKPFVGRVWFGPGAEGPPRHAHGGAMAAVLDEATGSAAWAAGHFVLSGELTIKFIRPLPLGTVVTVEAWVDEVKGRKVVSRGHLLGEDGKPYCKGKNLLIELEPSQFGPIDEVVKSIERLQGGGGSREDGKD